MTGSVEENRGEIRSRIVEGLLARWWQVSENRWTGIRKERCGNEGCLVCLPDAKADK